jgi:hypothetical protein
VKPSYRVRYSLTATAQSRSPKDVETIDLQSDLEQVPSLLPAGAYIMYIEDLRIGESVHWTRWPKAFRPGFGG